MSRRWIWVAVLTICLIGAVAVPNRDRLPLPVQETLGLRKGISEIRAFQTPRLEAALTELGLSLGDPVFIRIFKEEAELELYIGRGTRFEHFRSYPICNYSGDLGPKLREGDRQSPEGIYQVDFGALNPKSRFHLSFNLGFPNAFDRAHGRNGSFLMVHGNCVSIGCYAMTDPAIEEIYVLVEAALRAGQDAVNVHAFPFRPTPERLAQEENSKWHSFWSDLGDFYADFEKTGSVSPAHVVAKRYVRRTPPTSLY